MGEGEAVYVSWQGGVMVSNMDERDGAEITINQCGYSQFKTGDMLKQYVVPWWGPINLFRRIAWCIRNKRVRASIYTITSVDDMGE